MSALAMIEQPPIGNVETEAVLLGSMMQANQVIDQVADKLVAEDFSEPLHGRIFSVIVREHSMGRVANPVTLQHYFADDEAMKEVGGPGYLAQLTGSGAGVVGVNGFIEQIRELSQRRTMIEALREIMADAGNHDLTVAQLAADVEAAAAGAVRHQSGMKEMSAARCIAAARDAIDRQDPGVVSGIGAIDRAMGPIRKGNLAVLAARPAMGKTAVAISYSIGAARRGHGVLFVSLEMSSEELGERMACDLSYDTDTQLLYEAVTTGKLDILQARALSRAEDAMAELPIEVVDAASLPVARLRSLVRRWKRRFEARGVSLDLVIVDYLQKLRATGLTNRFEVITEISQTLKEVAKENDVGLLALAQLSRKVEERPDKRPQLADLRESGQIEQDADIVLFLLREEYYLRRSEPHAHDVKHDAWQAEMDRCAGEIEFICAKRRKGREGFTKGRFYGAYQAVRDLH